MTTKIKKGIWSDKNGTWYDSDGRPLTAEEKATLKEEIFEELDKDLSDKGFEGLVKKFAKYLLNKDGKGISKFFDLGEQPQGTFTFSTGTYSDDLEDINDELEEVAEEIADLASEMDELAEEMQELASQLEKLQAKQAELEKRRQDLMGKSV